MWGLIVMGLIWYGLFGKNIPKTARKVNEKKKNSGCAVFFLIIFALSVLSSFAPGMLGLAFASFVLGVPVLLISKLIQSANREATRRNNPEYKEIRENFNLTQSVSKRQKILSKFNEKYELNLNQEQIDRIVDASYMSYSWEKEIYDMTKDYERVSEWYKSDTSWLRAYLRAFPAMNISSDFEMQRSIVEGAFREILTELPPGDFMTIDSAIEETNRRFFTLFDEQSYMLMFRYMQTKGMNLEIPNALHKKQETEADRLAREYDEKVAKEVQDRRKKAVRRKKTSEEEDREEALDELQAFAEEQMGSMSDAELERLIRAYDKMMKEQTLEGDGGDDDPDAGRLRG
ncbi:MAG: DUF1761 domain-containing protein [Eubacterium sp.]|nr:DUF1761 domain-containing protein [Eubacterium sp.]